MLPNSEFPGHIGILVRHPHATRSAVCANTELRAGNHEWLRFVPKLGQRVSDALALPLFGQEASHHQVTQATGKHAVRQVGVVGQEVVEPRGAVHGAQQDLQCPFLPEQSLGLGESHGHAALTASHVRRGTWP